MCFRSERARERTTRFAVMLVLVRCLVLLHEPTQAENRIGRRFVVEHPGFRLGADKSSELVARDPEVRPLHARILAGGSGAAVVEDCTDSDAGTFVNDVRVETTRELQTGDEIRLGTTLLRFIDSAPGRTLESAYHEAIYWLVTHDPVTRVFRERVLLERVEELKQEGRGYLLLRFDLAERASFRTLRGLAGVLSRHTERLIVRSGPSRVTVLVPDAAVDDARATARTLVEALATAGLELTPTITTEIV